MWAYEDTDVLLFVYVYKGVEASPALQINAHEWYNMYTNYDDWARHKFTLSILIYIWVLADHENDAFVCMSMCIYWNLHSPGWRTRNRRNELLQPWTERMVRYILSVHDRNMGWCPNTNNMHADRELLWIPILILSSKMWADGYSNYAYMCIGIKKGDQSDFCYVNSIAWMKR